MINRSRDRNSIDVWPRRVPSIAQMFSLFGGAAGPSQFWPLTESAGVLRRDTRQTGDEFYPVNMGLSNGHALFVSANSGYLVACDTPTLAIGSDTAFTWAMRIKPLISVAGTTWILSKQDGADNNNYAYTIFQTAGVVFFRLGNGSAFQTVSDAVHKLVVGTETTIIFGHDPVNDIISLKIGNNTPVTAVWAGGTKHQTGGLFLGGLGGVAAPSSFFDGEIWNLRFYNGSYLSADEQTFIAGDSGTPTALVEIMATLDPNVADYTQYSRHDASDTSTLWQDAGKTTPVAADADPIRVFEDQWNNHDWTAPNDVVRPLWQDAELNGLGVLEHDGVDSELDFDQSWPNGDFTAFILCKNIDATDGSHIVTPALYLAITGSVYVSNPGGRAYAALHLSDLSSLTATLTNEDGWNIIEISRTGNVWRLVANGLVRDGLASYQKISAGNFNPNKTGPFNATSANWNYDGQLAELIRYAQYITGVDRMRIRAYLQNKWAVTNVQYRGL